MKRRKLNFLLIAVIAIMVTFSANSQVFKTVVAITGSVINEVTKTPLSAKFTVYDDAGTRMFNSRSNAAENGYYYIPKLQPGGKYVIKFDEMGFFKENFEITIPLTDKYYEVSRDFLIKPLIDNQQIPLKVSPFELNKSKLRYGASIVLEDIKNSLLANPRVKFTIISYPDNDNDKVANLTLTKSRAESLMDYLSTAGIDPSRMEAKGNESSDPSNPAPKTKTSKGKKYVGSVYILITKH